jgi:serine/threonine protein kinase
MDIKSDLTTHPKQVRPVLKLGLDKYDFSNSSILKTPRSARETQVTNLHNTLLLQFDPTSNTSCAIDALSIVRQVENGKTQAELTEYLFEMFSHIQKKPMDYRIFRKTSCIVQSISSWMSGESEQDDYVGRTIAASFGSGVYGAVVAGMFKRVYSALDFNGRITPFVTKATTYDKPVYNVSNECRSINESIVGQFALNPLRKIIPTFEYIFGSFKAPATSKKGGRLFDLTFDSNYTMLETIGNAQTLKKFLFSNRNSPVEINEIFFQITLALAIAKDHCDFMHQDLHAENVLVQKLDRKVTISFPIRGRVLYIETRYLARIIDFGYSRALVPVNATTLRNPASAALFEDSLSTDLVQRINGALYFKTGVNIWRAQYQVFVSSALKDVFYLHSRTVKDMGVGEAWLLPIFGNSRTRMWKVLNSWDDRLEPPAFIDFDLVEYFDLCVQNIPADHLPNYSIDSVPTNFAPPL